VKVWNVESFVAGAESVETVVESLVAVDESVLAVAQIPRAAITRRNSRAE
jgi:hypothetical protein